MGPDDARSWGSSPRSSSVAFMVLYLVEPGHRQGTQPAQDLRRGAPGARLEIAARLVRRASSAPKTSARSSATSRSSPTATSRPTSCAAATASRGSTDMEPELESSTAEQELIADMKQRELHLKSRLRATDSILLRAAPLPGRAGGPRRRAGRRDPRRPSSTEPWSSPCRTSGVVAAPWSGTVAVMAGLLGIPCGAGPATHEGGPARCWPGRRARLRDKYSEDLHSGRRWLQFYYRGEDISAYVPQILYFLEADPRFDTVDAALAFVKETAPRQPRTRRVRRPGPARSSRRSPHRPTSWSSRARDETGAAVEPGHAVRQGRTGPASGTSRPHRRAPKVPEFDRGRVALLTSPTPAGRDDQQQPGPHQPGPASLSRHRRPLPHPGARLHGRHDRRGEGDGSWSTR